MTWLEHTPELTPLILRRRGRFNEIVEEQIMPNSIPCAPPSELSPQEVKRLRKRVSARRLRRYVRELAAIPSRHILHSGNTYAVELLLDEFSQINGSLEVRARPLKGENRRLRNVEAVLRKHKRTGIIIVSAHLDSTAEGDPAFQPLIDLAPGADDDASGIAAVLLAADVISRLAERFSDARRREIRFVLFNAEEARQQGSRDYVDQLEDEEGSEVQAVLQMDMIGHPNDRGIFELHAGFKPQNDDTLLPPAVQKKSLKIANCIQHVARQVSPGLMTEIFPVGLQRDPAQGFSDHTSFHRADIPACLISEDFFPEPGNTTTLGTPNPSHHMPEDRPGKLDYIYAAHIARAVAATAWYLATRDKPPCLSAAASYNEAEGEAGGEPALSEQHHDHEDPATHQFSATT